jgi:hypothetical protein
MKNNCSRCNGDDPSCYVCQDRQIAEDIAQLEYAFEMHKMCCEHLQLNPDNDSEGDTLLEGIWKLEKDRNEWRDVANESLLKTLKQLDAFYNALRSIAVSDWKTAGELRKMAMDAYSYLNK